MRPNVFELLNKINELLLSSSVQDLSKLEFDLLKQNIQQLYEQVLVEREKKTEDTVIRNAVVEKTAKEIVEPGTENKEKYAETKIPDTAIQRTEVKQDLLPEEKTEPVIKVKTEEAIVTKAETVTSEPEAAKKITSKVSINEVSVSKESLNEKLKKGSKEMHKIYASKPLKDLIDLNKRFVLVKELFGGSSDAFTTTVEKIDSLSDFETAAALLNNELATAYNWDFNSQSVRLFVKLVKQKFGEHE